MRKAVDSALRFGCKGIKFASGRLNGAEIARKNGTCKAGCPCRRCARTSILELPRPDTYGVIGVKGWV